LSDLNPELEQFAVDAWRAPKRIFDAHPPDQCAQLRVDLRSPSLWARLPTPVAAKAGPVPTHECLGPDDCENLQDRRKPAIELDKEPAIMVREPDATRQPTPHDIQLMSKHRVLSFKPQLRLEWRGQDGQNETEQPDHSASLGDSITTSTRIRFSVHTGGDNWVKKTCARHETLSIAGFALKQNKFDGIYVGRRKGKDLVYAGKVDHGFDSASAKDLQARLKPLIRKQQPYAKKIAHRGVWVEPSLSAEIEYRAKSAEGKVRHPFFKGISEDL
jgi:hypothetical protein